MLCLAIAYVDNWQTSTRSTNTFFYVFYWIARHSVPDYVPDL